MDFFQFIANRLRFMDQVIGVNTVCPLAPNSTSISCHSQFQLGAAEKAKVGDEVFFPEMPHIIFGHRTDEHQPMRCAVAGQLGAEHLLKHVKCQKMIVD